jgi:anaerobic selenocysteine-containing dehydrogenase
VPLTVQIATHLNRSHLLHGRAAYLLPCIGRIEVDQQASGPQIVTVEDSTACIHASKGFAEPASKTLLSEPAIVAGLAKATLQGRRGKVDWDAWTADYSLVREAIEKTYPDQFKEFNARMSQPGGFHRPIPAAKREWKTKNGKANFITPEGMGEDPDMSFEGERTLRLMTTRGDSQFNTTVYGLDDRFRGVFNTRDVLLMNRDDMARLNIAEDQTITVTTVSSDDVTRSIDGLRAHAFDIPAGCAMGYYPECNPLIPLAHHAKRSKVPAAKAVPVRVRAT